jgi:hypothetical protein
MTFKELLYDYFMPGIVCYCISSANSLRCILININTAANHKFDYIIDDVIHLGTAISIVLGCFYLMVKIWLALKHKKV